MQLKSVCFFCFRTLWQVLAVSLVVLAVLVSALKYALPYADNYKEQIENMIHIQLGVDLEIGSIQASWQDGGPVLELNQVSFADNKDAAIALSIDRANLQINTLKSVKSLGLVSNYFVLDGFKADINLPEIAKNQGDSDLDQEALIEQLFLGQNDHFAIQNSQLNILNSAGKTNALFIDNVTWQNQTGLHQGVGTISLPGLENSSFQAQLTLTGEQLHEVEGSVYVSAEHINIRDWLGDFIELHHDSVKTDLNAALWLDVEKGKITAANMAWSPSVISWQENKVERTLGLNSAQFSLSKQFGEWHLLSSDIEFLQRQTVFPAFRFNAVFSGEAKSFWVESLEISLLRELAKLARFEGRQLLKSSQVQGIITAAKVSATSGSYNAWLSLDALNWQANESLPSLNNLNVEVAIEDSQGVMLLGANNTELDTFGLFPAPLSVNHFNASLDFDLSEGVKLTSNQIWLHNDDFVVAAELGLDLSHQAEMHLYAEVLGGNAKQTKHYLPTKIMQQSLVDYLNKSIINGEQRFTQVLFSGPFTQFPFKDASGQFEVRSLLDDVEFAFAPGWPSMKGAEVSLNFINERMDIYASNGQLINQTIADEVHVSIDDLNHAQTLNVDIQHHTQAESLKAFFAATPLKTPLENVFEQVQISGEVAGDIGLEVNLKTGEVVALGDVELNNNRVFIPSPGFDFNSVSGLFHFNNAQIELNSATANWLDMPMVIFLKGEQSKEHYELVINTQLEADSEHWLAYTSGLLNGYVEGKSQVNANVKLVFGDEGFRYQALVDSDLVGTESHFPMSYSKRSDEVKRLVAEVRGDDISNLITASYDERLFFNAILANNTGSMTNAHLIVGKENQGLTNSGFKVSIIQPELHLIDWIDFIDRLIKLSSKPSPEQVEPILPPLDVIAAEIDIFDISGIQFNELEMQLKPSYSGMDMMLLSKEMRTSVKLPKQGESRPIVIHSDYLRLNLPKATKDNEDADIDVGTAEEASLDWLTHIPAIKFTCDDCKVDAHQLEKVSISLAGDGSKLNIPSLTVTKRDHELSASGSWQSGVTQFNGELESDDFGELLSQADVTSSIKDSNARMNFDLNWLGAPYLPDISTLNGQIEWRLGEGHLTEVSDKGARVLSLLSLDSLIRKLKLDFRDVFSKGFFYNSMEGNFRLENGIAYTDKAEMDGVPADLTIKGYANLNTSEIEYNLAVAPRVTSSLPAIMAWMVNPVTGLATLALDQVIQSANVISEINFKVTGTLENPEITVIDRKSKEIKLPQPIIKQQEEEVQTQPEEVPVQNDKREVTLLETASSQ